ncbi:response regulator [Pseudoalteromonas sp. MMG010]|uniref:response regulator n=1 Tax=Pseudoalteromonas sp. MMG010 TaxID=2822685 RepID=UPI001B3A5B52|nr:response regulator [Pseudoalteromonas sp. MMG010]
MPLFIVFLFVFSHSTEQAKRLNIIAAQTKVVNAANIFNNYFSKHMVHVAMMAKDPRITSMNFPFMRDYLIAEKKSYAGDFEKFIVGDHQGHFYNTEGGNPKQGFKRTFNDDLANSLPRSIAKRDYWQKTVGENVANKSVVYVSEPMISYTTGVKQIVISASVLSDKQQVLGLLGGSIAWHEIDRLVQVVQDKVINSMDRRVKFMLVSRTGTYMYHWDKEKVLHLLKAGDDWVLNDIGEKVTVKHKILTESNQQIKNVGRAMVNAEIGFVEMHESDTNTDQHVFYAPINSTGYSIAVIIPNAVIFSDIKYLKDMLWLFFSAVLVILVIIALWLSRYIYRPINDLTNASHALSKGDYDYKVITKRGDELGKLASTFVAMRKELSLRETQLEKRVRNRTQAFELATTKAEHALATKSRFVANISHEIRTPLNGVFGVLQLLNKTSLADEQHKLIKGGLQSTQYLIALINNVLDMAKLESGEVVLNNEPVKLSDLKSQVMAVVTMQNNETKLPIEWEIEQPDLMIIIDKGYIKQLLIHLISNSLKFTEHGRICVRIYSEIKGNKADIRFCVLDTGIGISEDKLKLVFESFKQADESNTRVFGGGGLGLSLCKELVSLLDGQIEIRSKLNEGCEVEFVLPVLLGANDNTPVEENKPSALLSGHILLVEDNLVNQMVIKAMLLKLNLKVSIANDGLQGIAALEKHHFDLILMDMHMPNLDGVSATKKIRESTQWQAIPIIAVTANVLQKDIQACFDSGMNDYMGKPLDYELLKNKLEKWLTKNN